MPIEKRAHYYAPYHHPTASIHVPLVCSAMRYRLFSFYQDGFTDTGRILGEFCWMLVYRANQTTCKPYRCDYKIMCIFVEYMKCNIYIDIFYTTIVEPAETCGYDFSWKWIWIYRLLQSFMFVNFFMGKIFAFYVSWSRLHRFILLMCMNEWIICSICFPLMIK